MVSDPKISEIRQRYSEARRDEASEHYVQDVGYLLVSLDRMTLEQKELNDLPVGTDIRHLPSGRWSVDIPDCCVYEAGDTLAEAVTAASGASTVPSVSPCRAQLEHNVVEAALAERKSFLESHRNMTCFHDKRRAWFDALIAYEAAADALLAFLGEGAP